MTVIPKDNSEIHKDILDLKKDSNREITCKGLLSLAAVVAGVALIIFFSGSLLATGIGLVVVGGLALAHYIHQYRHTNHVFNRAAKALL